MPPTAKSNGYWYIRERISGVGMCDRSLGIKWKKQSEKASQAVMTAYAAVRAEYIAEKKHQRHVPGASIETMERLYWENKKQRETSVITMQGYRYHWQTLRRFFTSLENCSTTQQINEFVYKRGQETTASGKRISGKTIKEELRAFFCAWQCCLDAGVAMPPKPQWPKHVKGKERPNEAQKNKPRSAKLIRRFIRALPTKEGRDRVWLCALTGLRFEETNRIHLGKLFRSTRYPGIAGFLWLKPECTKERHERLIALVPKAWRICKRNWPFASRNNRKQMETASRKLGLPLNLTCRDLRGSFASGLRVQAKVTQQTIELAMGHRGGMNARYQDKESRQAAVEVARAAWKWLTRGQSQKRRCVRGVQSPKVVGINSSRQKKLKSKILGV